MASPLPRGSAAPAPSQACVRSSVGARSRRVPVLRLTSGTEGKDCVSLIAESPVPRAAPGTQQLPSVCVRGECGEAGRGRGVCSGSTALFSSHEKDLCGVAGGQSGVAEVGG